jgi:2'-5' RNA ligase
MRAFIALELSDEVRAELARLESALKETAADVKWVKPENIHLTLKFLGNIEEAKAEEVTAVLNNIASRNHAFEISLFKLGGFPSLNYPRVIWVGIGKGCGETDKIAKSIEDELEKIGFPKENRPFNAHLTLGRVKSGRNKAELKEKLLALELRRASCAVSHITLFESKLTPHGPIYTERARPSLKIVKG